jgi:hypothetical protein
MKILIFVALLAVMQAAPPVPRQTANSPAATSERVQKHSAPENTPSTQTPSPAVNAKQTPDHNPSGDWQRNNDAPHPVVIRELHPVTVASPKRDWADWGTWGFNFFLLVTSGLQVWLLCKTLTFIRRQTHEMKKQRVTMQAQLIAAKESADTAKASVGIVISKERARIRVNPETLIFPSGVTLHSVNYKVFNYGYTRAFIERAQAEISVTGNNNPPQNPEWSLPMGLPPAVEPNTDGLAKSAFFFPIMGLSPDQIESIRKGKSFVHFWGAVQYRDVFYETEKDLRVTRFSYVWLYSEMPALPPPVPGKSLSQEKFGFWFKNGTETDNYET